MLLNTFNMGQFQVNIMEEVWNAELQNIKKCQKEPDVISKWYDIFTKIGQDIEIDRNG